MTLSKAEREWLISYHETTRKEFYKIINFYDDMIKQLDEKIFKLEGHHEWKHACNTPAGADAGDDEIYVCIHCGEETDTRDMKYKTICPTPENNVQCLDCKPHPKHRSGKCHFACGCKTDSESEGANK